MTERSPRYRVIVEVFDAPPHTLDDLRVQNISDRLRPKVRLHAAVCDALSAAGISCWGIEVFDSPRWKGALPDE